MNRPRLLVIGRNGQVGWELLRALAPLGDVEGVDYPDLDLAEASNIRRWLARVEPDVVVNAGAYTAVDEAESEPERAMAINGLAPGVLAEWMRARGGLLVHYSSDYVFDGRKRSAYTETDSAEPLNCYGRSKLAGERAVVAVGGRHLVFRLCWVYGLRGNNFCVTIRRLARDRDVLRVVNDQIGCPTWARLVAEATAVCLSRVLGEAEPERFDGIYHLSATTSTSWHGFASAIVAAMPATERRCIRVDAILASEYPAAACRPAWSVLDGGKVERVFGVRLPGWEEGFRLALEGGVPAGC